MENSYNYRFNYSEDVAPKYPDVQRNQEGLEVVPNDSPLYPLPTHAPARAVEDAKWASPSPWGSEETKAPKEEKRRILGLSIVWFWVIVILITLILAGGIGGGVGGAIRAQQQVAHGVSSDTSSTTSSSSGPTTAPTSSPTPSPTAGLSSPLPSDGGCPAIEGQTYTPYAVDGKAIPLEAAGQGSGSAGQLFRQQCYTNYVSSAAARTHDILRIFMPTLENCMMACAEYNAAYRAALAAGDGVGGGYCVAVSLVKQNAGFCYLKNGTAVNDTMGRPDVYSSAVLVTDTGSD
ncbi:hypothetical protein F4779DRAFT_294671 [Xylariaceae sp. FL0662B]|nr:hypothetical protein F4779DRAFT_294671 [Xylariaceae sp. FL0662B]